MNPVSAGGTRLAGLVALCSALGAAGCASRIEAPRPAAAAAVVNPPRSERGNPPFYEVYGRRYYVLDSSAGYDERGIASWYGRDFHKQATSSGETYDMYAMTAAHKTLPLPTWVEVTNLANRKSVLVKVNDRGPFVKNRLIDLSYAAAKALDMVGTGTARVEVRALGAAQRAARVASPAAPPPAAALASTAPRAAPALASPAPRAAPALASAAPRTATALASPALAAPGAERPARRHAAFSLISEAAADEITQGDEPGPPVRARPSSGERLFIQVGAFTEPANALRLVARLKAQGYENAFVVTGARDSLNRVRVGPLASADDYDRVSEGLHRLGIAETRLVAERSAPR